MTSRVVDGPLDPAEIVRGTEDAASGALVVVTGARDGDGPAAGDGGAGADTAGAADDGGTGPPAAREAADPADADRLLGELEGEALDRFDVRRCRLRARPGAPPGEPAVAAVVRAPHRRAAFDAARWAVTSALGRLPVRGGP